MSYRKIMGTEIESPVAKAVIYLIALPVVLAFIAVVLLLSFVFVAVVLALAFGIVLIALTADAVSSSFRLPDRRSQKRFPPHDPR